MEDGRPITEGSKYKAAIEKNVKIINEDDFLKMIRDSDPEGSARYAKEQEIEKQKEAQKLVSDLIVKRRNLTRLLKWTRRTVILSL